jgi:hypothetical protein
LNSSIRERVEHNLKYNDDTIFANLDIFKDCDQHQKVHGKKDKFNASTLLSVKFEDLYSDEEPEEKPFKVDESSIIKPVCQSEQTSKDLEQPLDRLDSIKQFFEEESLIFDTKK